MSLLRAVIRYALDDLPGETGLDIRHHMLMRPVAAFLAPFCFPDLPLGLFVFCQGSVRLQCFGHKFGPRRLVLAGISVGYEVWNAI